MLDENPLLELPTGAPDCRFWGREHSAIIRAMKPRSESASLAPTS